MVRPVHHGTSHCNEDQGEAATIKPLVTIAATCAVAFLFAFLTHRQLIVGWTVRDAHGRDSLGGTRLTKRAQELVNNPKNPMSVQAVFEGAQYYPDRVWTPSSLAWTRTIVTFLLLAPQTTATVALASSSPENRSVE